MAVDCEDCIIARMDFQCLTLLLPPALCSMISCAASCGLLYWLWVARERRTTLMARLLWHLAMADMLFSLSYMVFFFIQVLGHIHAIREPELDGLCANSSAVVVGAFFTSALVEVFLSFSLAGALFHSASALKCFQHLLFAVGPLALTLTLWKERMVREHWSSSQNTCTESENVVVDVVAAVSLIICLTTYVVCLIQASRIERIGLSVRMKVLSRVRFFVLSWFVCTLPDGVRTMKIWPLLDAYPFTPLCQCLLSLRGFADTVVYALQSNYIQRLEMRSQSEPISVSMTQRRPLRFSFQVNFGETMIVEESHAQEGTRNGDEAFDSAPDSFIAL